MQAHEQEGKGSMQPENERGTKCREPEIERDTERRTMREFTCCDWLQRLLSLVDTTDRIANAVCLSSDSDRAVYFRLREIIVAVVGSSSSSSSRVNGNDSNNRSSNNSSRYHCDYADCIFLRQTHTCVYTQVNVHSRCVYFTFLHFVCVLRSFLWLMFFFFHSRCLCFFLSRSLSRTLALCMCVCLCIRSPLSVTCILMLFFSSWLLNSFFFLLIIYFCSSLNVRMCVYVSFALIHIRNTQTHVSLINSSYYYFVKRRRKKKQRGIYIEEERKRKTVKSRNTCYV